MWTLICATAPFVCAQETAGSDSTEYSVSQRMLGEVVVKASPVVSRIDRKVFRPSREAVRSSTDGIDLMRKLRLPHVMVNPLTNDITVAGGGDVVLCINGVEATSAQVTAIRPQDILRVEYHDNPGVRYAGASAVIDFITSRHDAGGHLLFDAFGALASGRHASISHLAAQYNKGRSVWSVNAGYMGQRKNKWIRDYDEEWYGAGTPVVRHESGLPVSVGGAGLESRISYNCLYPSGNVLDVRVDLDADDVPNMEEGDRRAWLSTSESGERILVTEHTGEHSVRPGLGMYYLHKISEGSSLTLDVQGTFQHSRVLHEYSENAIGEQSRVDGDRFTVRWLGLFENRVGGRAWSAGLSGNSSFMENTYRQGDIPAVVKVRRSEAALTGEYSNRFGRWGISGNARLEYRHLAQGLRDIDGVFFLPSASVSFRPFEKCFLRYAVSLDYTMPAAAEISDVEQPIQTGMVRRGNPALQPFRVTVRSLVVSYDSRFVRLEGRMEYRDERNPVMESVIFEENRFVRTFLNQRSFRRLTAGGSVSVRPWKDHLSLTAEPVLTRYFSRGTDYRHDHTVFRVGMSADFSYGHWLAYGSIIPGPANRMYGEEITEEKDMNQIMVGHKRGAWSVCLGVFNAFVKNYWMETRNLSALAPYTSKAHSGRSSSYVAVKFSLSLDFGRKGRDVGMPAETDRDMDSGILSGTK